MRPDMADLGQTVGQSLRGIKIRKALRQIDGAAGERDPGHAANHRVRKLFRRSIQFLHIFSSFCPFR